MARPKGSRGKKQPSYRKHASGQAVTTIAGKDHYLGKHGTKESRNQYDRLIGEWLLAGRAVPSAKEKTELTVSELIVMHYSWFIRQPWQHDELKPKLGCPQVRSARIAFRILRRLYGSTRVMDFGPLALRNVLEEFARTPCANSPKRLWSASTCNSRMLWITGMFKWAARNELCPASIYQALLTVRFLQPGEVISGRTIEAGRHVQPCDEADFEYALGFASPQTQAILNIQRFTGMRIGEVLRMRPVDIEIGDGVWLYKPPVHKTMKKGRVRMIPLGPKAQAAITPYLQKVRNIQGFIFSPVQNFAETRKTPGNSEDYTKTSGRFAPRYTTSKFSRTVRKMCERAAAAAEANGRKFTIWRSHQLRHLMATTTRKEYGLETARALLGHACEKMTEVYAEVDYDKAVLAVKSSG